MQIIRVRAPREAKGPRMAPACEDEGHQAEQTPVHAPRREHRGLSQLAIAVEPCPEPLGRDERIASQLGQLTPLGFVRAERGSIGYQLHPLGGHGHRRRRSFERLKAAARNESTAPPDAGHTPGRLHDRSSVRR